MLPPLSRNVLQHRERRRCGASRRPLAAQQPQDCCAGNWRNRLRLSLDWRRPRQHTARPGRGQERTTGSRGPPQRSPADQHSIGAISERMKQCLDALAESRMSS